MSATLPLLEIDSGGPPPLPARPLPGVLDVPAEAPFFADHFPRCPVFPATLLLDAQIRIAAQRRRYDADAQERLFELSDLLASNPWLSTQERNALFLAGRGLLGKPETAWKVVLDGSGGVRASQTVKL